MGDKTIEAVFRIESSRLIGGLLRVVRDLSVAEDLAQEALVVALEKWPSTGIPSNPGAWLMTTAKNRAIDHLRRRRMLDNKHAELVTQLSTELSIELPADTTKDVAGGAAAEGRDDVLRLMLIACHPVLSKEARTALTLRLLGGLTTEEIAHAFFMAETTIAQRIVRAKRTLSEARVPFEVPVGDELKSRLNSVLEVIYLIFNAGYAATTGTDTLRPELVQDALRLGRVLANLVPDEAEVHGLVALMELHASRMRTRVDASGDPVLLYDQNRARWDQLLMRRGLLALQLAESLSQPLGQYTLQAAISACHARAKLASETDWQRIVALYDALVEVTGSPVVELNRAVAVSMAFGAEAGLALVDELAAVEALRGYHFVPSVRADLLFKLGRHAEARREFERAAFMASNPRDKKQLLQRSKECG